MKEYLGILIDTSRDQIIPEKGLALLSKKGFYKKDNETSPQETMARAATCYCFGDYDFAQRMYDYQSKGWYVDSSPVKSNAVEVLWPTFGKNQFQDAGDWLEENVTADGMPISCFLSSIPDTKEGLTETRTETAWLSMMGGGVGVYTGNRSPDEKSTGVMAHLKGYDADTLSYKQKESRRGSIAAYMDVNHPEIKQFITMRDPAGGGDINKKCFNLNNAVNLTDDFMWKVISGEEYELVDPKHGPTGEYLSARKVFEELMEMRHQTGEPYLNFIDTVNKSRRSWITKKSYYVTQSNLCNEIHLMTSAKRTAVCCLSSLNLAKYEEWKDTNIVQDLCRYLDNVLEYFIRLAPPQLKRAVHSASQERAIGIGTLGWHSLLQSKNLAFESGGANSASSLNYEVYSHIESEFIKASRQLAVERGEPEDCIGGGMRNSHGIAIAPNVSSADMVGESCSIEPWKSNAFVAQGRSGSFLVKNKYLEKVLEELGKNNGGTWKHILDNEGSVRGLEFMSDHHKKVFATAKEIDPMWIIEHASLRQPMICQGQSVNTFKDNSWTMQDMVDLHIAAWAKGLKGLYYMRGEAAESVNLKGGDSVKPPLNQVRPVFKLDECLSCHG